MDVADIHGRGAGDVTLTAATPIATIEAHQLPSLFLPTFASVLSP
jgi:hypothetical protein